MQLLIDLGNTRLKWGWSERGELHVGRAAAYGPETLTATLERLFSGLQAEAVWIASVASAQVNGVLDSWCRQRLGAAPIFLKSQQELHGVKNAYTNPERLGVDRWLALIAANQYVRAPVCIVGCGTAVTIDVLEEDGVHVGGLILPGLYLMRQSLSQHTAAAKWNPDDNREPGWFATDTQQAIESGTLISIVGAVEAVSARYRENKGRELNCVITGGDAAIVQSLLNITADVMPDLVLEGIALIAMKDNAKSS